MKGPNPLIPTPEHIRDFERYSDELLDAIRASSIVSGMDKRAADHVLFVRAVRTSDKGFTERRWKGTR